MYCERDLSPRSNSITGDCVTQIVLNNIFLNLGRASTLRNKTQNNVFLP